MLPHASRPVLLHDLIDDRDAVVDLFERGAPYTPLGGWFRPDHDGGEATPSYDVEISSLKTDQTFPADGEDPITIKLKNSKK